MILLAQLASLSEPTLWGIVLVLSGIVAKFGMYVVGKLNDCEDDREVLHSNVATIAGAYSAITGKPLDLKTLNP
jgi:4-hydroxybenzoate polyprenyltransferase